METIIFLPGLSLDDRLYSHQIETLQSQYYCKTIVCNTADTMQGLVNNVLVQAPEKFIVIRHSFGGVVAQWLATQAPERVSKLILIGTGPGKLSPELERIFLAILTKVEKDKAQEFFDSILENTIKKDRLHDSELVNNIRAMQVAFPKQGLINQVKVDLDGRDTTPYLKNIKCDTLLIYGKQDLFYQEERVVLKKHIPHSEHMEIDHCAHMVTLEKPELVTTAIEPWLEQQPLAQNRP